MTNMDDDISSDDGYAGMTRDQWKEYSRQIKASDGFDVDEFPPAYGIIRPVEVNHCIDLAIDHYEQKEKVRLKLLNILKVNSKLTSMTLYITFEAGDTSTGHGRIYQTSVYSPFKVEDAEVLLMRLKPENKPNEASLEIEQEDKRIVEEGKRKRVDEDKGEEERDMKKAERVGEEEKASKI